MCLSLSLFVCFSGKIFILCYIEKNLLQISYIRWWHTKSPATARWWHPYVSWSTCYHYVYPDRAVSVLWNCLLALCNGSFRLLLGILFIQLPATLSREFFEMYEDCWQGNIFSRCYGQMNFSLAEALRIEGTQLSARDMLIIEVIGGIWEIPKEQIVWNTSVDD